MTVREHLQFYGRLKGNMSTKELNRDINEYNLINSKFKNLMNFFCYYYY